MLITYFLRRFMQQASIYFAVLVALFLSCNLVTKLPVVYTFSTIPVLIWLLLPVMALFALPLAASMAVFSVVASHKIYDELLMLDFLPPARRALRRAGLLFALGTGLIYAILALCIAPNSYLASKKVLITAVKDQLVQLEPGIFHQPLPMVSFFVQEKHYDQVLHSTVFTNLMLVITQRSGEWLLFTAHQGFFYQGSLALCRGRLVALQGKQVHAAAFQRTYVNLESYVGPGEQVKGLSGAKFQTISGLLGIYSSNHEAYFELHKRFAQTLWHIILVLLALVLAYLLQQSSLLASICWCGSIFLFSYIMVALGQTLQHVPILALALLYGPAVAAMLLILVILKIKGFL